MYAYTLQADWKLANKTRKSVAVVSVLWLGEGVTVRRYKTVSGSPPCLPCTTAESATLAKYLTIYIAFFSDPPPPSLSNIKSLPLFVKFFFIRYHL